VVDDGRDDATRDLVRQLGARQLAARQPPLRYLRPSRGRGPAQARNIGWRNTAAPLVAFTDDDTEPAPDWLAEGLRALAREPHWVAAAGQVVVPLLRDRAPNDNERMTHGLQSAEFVTANAFVRRSALERVGGFDERFTAAWREDSDLQFRLLALGPVGRVPEARVLHPVRPERWGVCLRRQRNVFFDALLYRKHRRLYRQRIRPMPPWDHYAIVALVLAAAGFAAAAAPVAASVAAVLALLFVLRLALRRLRGADHSLAHVAEMLATSALIPFLSVYWRLRGAIHFRVPFW
ncbi:MAG: glycosyltransferase, partial [Rubrivivax sp.]|nr:glycosyltransferase [Rubrivivax sp.]